MTSDDKNWLKFYAVALFIALIIVLLNGCVYHHEIVKEGGELIKEKKHIGFPEFSDGKEINLIKVN
jgi:hypothetical protein